MGVVLCSHAVVGAQGLAWLQGAPRDRGGGRGCVHLVVVRFPLYVVGQAWRRSPVGMPAIGAP